MWYTMHGVNRITIIWNIYNIWFWKIIKSETKMQCSNINNALNVFIVVLDVWFLLFSGRLAFYIKWNLNEKKRVYTKCQKGKPKKEESKRRERPNEIVLRIINTRKIYDVMKELNKTDDRQNWCDERCMLENFMYNNDTNLHIEPKLLD